MIVGVNVKKPKAIMSNIIPEAILISGILSEFHKKIASKGDSGSNIEGVPRIPCKLIGKGKIAAPSIENEKVSINNIGIVLSFVSFAVL